MNRDKRDDDTYVDVSKSGKTIQNEIYFNKTVLDNEIEYNELLPYSTEYIEK